MLDAAGEDFGCDLEESVDFVESAGSALGWREFVDEDFDGAGFGVRVVGAFAAFGGLGEGDGEGLEATEAEDGIEGDGDGGGMVTVFLGLLEGRGPCVAGFRFCERA